MWLLGWFFTILLYIIGVALFGPVWKSTSELGSATEARRVDGMGRPKFDFHTGSGRRTTF
jgi:hypothetical protein